MRVKVTTPFRDRTAGLALRKKGQILEVDEERAVYLAIRGLAERIRDPVEQKIEEE